MKALCNIFKRKSKDEGLVLYKGAEVELNPNVFGPGLRAESKPASFVFGSGGVGDYINWCSSIKYIHETYPHVDGQLFTSELFLGVARHLFGNYPRWRVEHLDTFPTNHVQGSILAFPKPNSQLLNACGAHLMDLGFAYFLCKSPPPPEHNYLLEINYNGVWKWPELDPKSSYAVFTPGSTTDVREMPVQAFDELVAFTKSKGITPVFLGKRVLSKEYKAKFLNYDFSQGIDLRERTDLLEAVQVMRGARFVIGLDNGLLHMAGTTDVPIIFGHNIASPEHRYLRRRKGLTLDMVVSEKDLACIGCQSKMRFIDKHDFRFCFFKDREPEKEKLCLVHLFEDGSREWKLAIEKVLSFARR